jgi:hypothetical protein
MMNKKIGNGSENKKEKDAFGGQEARQSTQKEIYQRLMGRAFDPNNLEEKYPMMGNFNNPTEFKRLMGPVFTEPKFSLGGLFKGLVSLLRRDSEDSDLTVRVDVKTLEQNQKAIDELKKSQHDKNKDLPHVTPLISDEDHTIVEIDGVMHVVKKDKPQ